MEQQHPIQVKGIQVSSSATLGDYDLSAVSYLYIAARPDTCRPVKSSELTES